MAPPGAGLCVAFGVLLLLGACNDANLSREDRLQRHVGVLASEAFEGRATGGAGERLAARYLADQFAALGLQPFGFESGEGFFQRFEFTASVRLGAASVLTWEEGAELALDRDWRPLAFSETGTHGPFGVIFGGYGFAAPETEEVAAIDSYGAVDVSGRWLVVLRDWPDGASDHERRHWGRYAGLRYKAILARERGAAGVIVVQRPTSQRVDETRDPLVPLRFDGTAGDAAIPVISLSEARLDEMLDGTGHSTASLRERLDAGEVLGAFAIPGVSLRARVDLEHETREGRNVVGRLGVGDPEAPALVIGAHYDHLGRAARRGSLARAGERDGVHYGADDNASGVAALLEIARDLRERVDAGALEPVRDVVFAAWSGEELGLLGSHEFVARAGGALNQEPGGRGPRGCGRGPGGCGRGPGGGGSGSGGGVHGGVSADPHAGRTDPHTAASRDLRHMFAANLNLDMVGRLEDTLSIQGGGSSTNWSAIVERAAAQVPIPHALQEDSLLPTDASSFVTRGVPVLSGFTGAHAEYHTPRDTADLLNYPGLDQVTAFFAELAAILAAEAEPPDFVAPRRREGGAHANRSVRLRAYLGTVPDYAAAAEGLALAAVVAEGPAEKAGLRGGDVVTSLGDRAVRNVYDYTFAIEALRPGEPVVIGVDRDGRALEFAVTPGSRD